MLIFLLEYGRGTSRSRTPSEPRRPEPGNHRGLSLILRSDDLCDNIDQPIVGVHLCILERAGFGTSTNLPLIIKHKFVDVPDY